MRGQRWLNVAAAKFAVAGITMIVGAGLFTVPSALAADESAHKRPNIIVILADDLGYSDIGALGGEIHTPNLDKLAAEGTRFTSFYASPFCSPTRAMLTSRLDNHEAGFGDMAELMVAEQKGKPG